jgi:hypothetical protein
VGFLATLPGVTRINPHPITHCFYKFNSGPNKYTLYSLFLSSLALHVSGAICTHHQEHNCSVQP